MESGKLPRRAAKKPFQRFRSRATLLDPTLNKVSFVDENLNVEGISTFFSWLEIFLKFVFSCLTTYKYSRVTLRLLHPLYSSGMPQILRSHCECKCFQIGLIAFGKVLVLRFVFLPSLDWGAGAEVCISMMHRCFPSRTEQDVSRMPRKLIILKILRRTQLIFRLCTPGEDLQGLDFFSFQTQLKGQSLKIKRIFSDPPDVRAWRFPSNHGGNNILLYTLSPIHQKTQPAPLSFDHLVHIDRKAEGEVPWLTCPSLSIALKRCTQFRFPLAL